MAPEVQYTLLYVSGVVAFMTILALLLRPKLDRSKMWRGEVDPSDLPRHGMSYDVVDGGTLHSIGSCTILQVAMESHLFSFSYGVMTVFICNGLLVGRVPDSVGWLLTQVALFNTVSFMCHVPMNMFHVMADQMIHISYYSCGFLSILFYKVLPDSEHAWLVGVSTITHLLVHTGFRLYTLPNYPHWSKIVPLYTRTASANDIVLFSDPGKDPSSAFALYANREKELGESICGKKFGWFVPLVGQLECLRTTWAPFPNYELLNAHVAINVGYGYVIGFAVSHFVVEIDVAFACAAGIALVWSSFYVTIGTGMGQFWLALSRFYPRLTTFPLVLMGAISMVVQRFPHPHPSEFDLSVVLPFVMHGSHVLGGAVFLLAGVGTVHYKGFNALWSLTRYDPRCVDEKSTIHAV